MVLGKMKINHVNRVHFTISMGCPVDECDYRLEIRGAGAGKKGLNWHIQVGSR